MSIISLSVVFVFEFILDTTMDPQLDVLPEVNNSWFHNINLWVDLLAFYQ